LESHSIQVEKQPYDSLLSIKLYRPINAQRLNI
jgi:hypothetical protein